MAEVSAGLIGLFLVGVFFYVETGFRRLGPSRGIVESYFRASTRIVLVLFAIPLSLSLTLVVLAPAWNGVLFAALSLVLIAANLDTARRIRPVQRAMDSRALLANEVIGSLGVVALVTVPWLLGGIWPTREDFTWAILLSFSTAFASLAAMVLSVFDLARLQGTSGVRL